MDMLVIGLGKVGTSLALAAMVRGVSVIGLDKNPPDSAMVPFDVYSELENIPALPAAIFIAVYDNAIETVATQLAAHFKEKLAGVCIFHSSGVLGRDLLSDCAKYGAVTAAAHPFQTFAHISSKLFEGIPWGIDCLDQDREIWHKIIHVLGGNAIFLNESLKKNKALYHAIGVAASNYLVSAVQFAKELCIVAGIPHRELLTHICNTSVANSIDAAADQFPLTGPLARADQETINKHLAALSRYPDLSLIYSLLGESTQLLAKKRDLIPDDTEMF